MSDPQQLLPCIDDGEHRFTAINYQYKYTSGVLIYCTRCGVERERLSPGWEERQREGIARGLAALTGDES